MFCIVASIVACIVACIVAASKFVKYCSKCAVLNNCGGHIAGITLPELPCGCWVAAELLSSGCFTAEIASRAWVITAFAVDMDLALITAYAVVMALVFRFGFSFRIYCKTRCSYLYAYI